MRSAQTNRRSIAQRARRDAEAEALPRPCPPIIPHGTPVGSITIELHGQTVRALLMQAGDRCRTYGVVMGDDEVQLLGLYVAAALVSSRVARLPSKRSDFWRESE